MPDATATDSEKRYQIPADEKIKIVKYINTLFPAIKHIYHFTP